MRVGSDGFKVMLVREKGVRGAGKRAAQIRRHRVDHIFPPQKTVAAAGSKVGHRQIGLTPKRSRVCPRLPVSPGRKQDLEPKTRGRLRCPPDLSVADFGTRRRHSFLWQEYVVNAMAANLGGAFTGTSNAFLAHKHDLEAIGTNAHEIPMVMAALATDDDALRASQYRVLELWQATYEGALRIMLPDTFGTTQFLENAPTGRPTGPGSASTARIPTWPAMSISTGSRRAAAIRMTSSSLPPTRSTWTTFLDCTPIFCGALANGVTSADFYSASDFNDPRKWTPGRRIRFSAGWGTFLANDFRGCDPAGGSLFDPIGLICKVSTVDGKPAVKLSDNYNKALGTPSEIERYRRVFGAKGFSDIPVIA